jgi:hypothetical protein
LIVLLVVGGAGANARKLVAMVLSSEYAQLLLINRMGVLLAPNWKSQTIAWSGVAQVQLVKQ